MGTFFDGFKMVLVLSALTVAAVMLAASIAGAEETAPFTLTSSVFSEGTRIPDLYTCTDRNVSPPLAWSGVPKGTVSMALIMEDPDATAKPWVHWVMYNIDPMVTGLPEGVSIESIGALSGTTSFSKLGYGGPCPPVGKGDHHYIFTLFALSADPGLKEGATRVEVLAAVADITIATAKLIGLYSR